MKNKSKNNTQKLVITAMLAATATVLYFFEFPVIPLQPHLKLDFSDLPAFIAAVLLGPGMGVAVELIKNVIEMMIRGIGSQMGYGNLMNFLVGCAYILPYAWVSRKWRGKTGEWKRMLLASLIGMASIVLVGMVGNYLLAPLYFRYFLGVELSGGALWAAIWSATIINVIKGVLLSLFGVLYWKGIEPSLRRAVRPAA